MQSSKRGRDEYLMVHMTLIFRCCKECEDEIWRIIDPDMDTQEHGLELGIGEDRPDWAIELEERYCHIHLK